MCFTQPASAAFAVMGEWMLPLSSFSGQPIRHQCGPFPSSNSMLWLYTKDTFKHCYHIHIQHDAAGWATLLATLTVLRYCCCAAFGTAAFLRYRGHPFRRYQLFAYFGIMEVIQFLVSAVPA
jgi:hypothetical protein